MGVRGHYDHPPQHDPQGETGNTPTSQALQQHHHQQRLNYTLLGEAVPAPSNARPPSPPLNGRPPGLAYGGRAVEGSGAAEARAAATRAAPGLSGCSSCVRGRSPAGSVEVRGSRRGFREDRRVAACRAVSSLCTRNRQAWKGVCVGGRGVGWGGGGLRMRAARHG